MVYQGHTMYDTYYQAVLCGLKRDQFFRRNVSKYKGRPLPLDREYMRGWG